MAVAPVRDDRRIVLHLVSIPFIYYVSGAGADKIRTMTVSMPQYSRSNNLP
jgi:hypothetical protein